MSRNDVARMAENYRVLAAQVNPRLSHNECDLWARYMLTPEQMSLSMLGHRYCARLIFDHKIGASRLCGKQLDIRSGRVLFCSCRSEDHGLIYFDQTLSQQEWDEVCVKVRALLDNDNA